MRKHRCKYESRRGGQVSDWLRFLACRCGNIMLYNPPGESLYERKSA